jgi:hypothetical protein
MAADLTWAQVHSFRLARHQLMARAPKRYLARVVGATLGLADVDVKVG